MELTTRKQSKNDKKLQKRKRQPSQTEAHEISISIANDRAHGKMERTPVSEASSIICDVNSFEKPSQGIYRYSLSKKNKYQNSIKTAKGSTAQVSVDKQEKKVKKIAQVNVNGDEIGGPKVSSSEIHLFSDNITSELEVKNLKKAKSKRFDSKNVGLVVSPDKIHTNISEVKVKKSSKKSKSNRHDFENVGMDVPLREAYSNDVSSEAKVRKSKKSKSNGHDCENVEMDVPSKKAYSSNGSSEVRVKKSKKAKSNGQASVKVGMDTSKKETHGTNVSSAVKVKKSKKTKSDGHVGVNIGMDVSIISEIHNSVSSEVRLKKGKKVKSNKCVGKNVGADLFSSEMHIKNTAPELEVKKTKKDKSKINLSNISPAQCRTENELQTISRDNGKKVKVSTKGKSKVSKVKSSKKGNSWSEKVKLANKEELEESDAIGDKSGKVENLCRIMENSINSEERTSKHLAEPASLGKQKKVKASKQKKVESLELNGKKIGKTSRKKRHKNMKKQAANIASNANIENSHFYSCNYSNETFGNKTRDTYFQSYDSYPNKVYEMYDNQKEKIKNIKRIPKLGKDMLSETRPPSSAYDENDSDMCNINRTDVWRERIEGDEWINFESLNQSSEAVIEGENVHSTVQRRKSKAQERREQERLEQRIAEREREQLISEPLDVIPIEENSFIVVIFPGHCLYLHGIISVRLLVGQAMILGYKMDKMEEQNVFSISSHALLGVQTTEGCKLSVSQHSHLLNCGLTEEQLQVLVDKQTDPVTVIKLKRALPPVSQHLCDFGLRYLLYKSSGGINALNGMLITHGDYQRYPLVKEIAKWREVIDDIRLCFECGDAPCVVVCGGKGVGKSTFLKYVINGLLSVKGTKLQCLDVDPGQSEFSLPSCLSLTQISEPVLGPSYTHYVDPSSPDTKQILLGGVSPQFGLRRYVNAIMELYELSKKKPKRPLIINTMGWTIGTGLDLIFDTIRTVKPTHLIQIQGNNSKNNFRLKLYDEVVHSSLGGILTKPCDEELHYRFIELLSPAGRKGKALTLTPKHLREVGVMVQLSDILMESSCNTVVIHWPEIVLHICGSKFPRQRILQVLNGNMVALCQVDPDNIELSTSDLPKHLVDDLNFGQCLGWGIVRGIDPLTQSLHVLTSFPSDKFSTSVNALIMPELFLPEKFYKLFSKGEGPYLQKLSRAGASKLKVGRMIKPNMPKLRASKN